MDTELIERLAREAGIEYEDLTLKELRDGRVRFAALIAEECAKTANEYRSVDDAIEAMRAQFVLS